MYMIQNGPSWWVDQVARFPVGQSEERGRDGAMSNTYSRNPLDTSDSSESNNAVISDVEEEGEAGDTHERGQLHGWTMDDVDDEIIAGGSSGGASDKDASDRSFQESMKGDMLQDPAAAFEATSPSQDRLGLLSLLKH